MEQYRILKAEDIDDKFFEEYKNLIEKNFTYTFDETTIKYYTEIYNIKKLSEITENSGLIAIFKKNDKVKGLILGAGPEAGVGTVIWIVTDQYHRYSGIGKKLFAIAQQHYKTLRCHKIKLNAPSEDAVKFYNKIGMTTEGFHPNHWYNKDFWSLGIIL